MENINGADENPLDMMSVKQEITPGMEQPASSSSWSAEMTHENRLATLTDSEIRLSALQTSLKDKNSQLSHTWFELNQMLSEYQAELFTAQTKLINSKSEYEEISDIDQLKMKLVEKETENSELRNTISNLENQHSISQMDLSVKESLLKKYQQDLLEKEARILSLLNTNKKLENRIAVLEGKPAMTSRKPGGSSVHHKRRSVGPGTLQSKRRQTMPGASIPMNQSHQSAAGDISSCANTSVTDQQNSMYCEVADDQEIQDINQSLSQSDTNVNDSLYLDNLPDTDATQSESLPGSSSDYYGQQQQQYDMSGHTVPDTSAINALMAQEGAVQGIVDAQGVVKDGGKTKGSVCPHCSRISSNEYNLKKHIEVVHLRILKYTCDVCQAKFGQKSQLETHMNRHLGVKPYQCSICNSKFDCRNAFNLHSRYCAAKRDRKANKEQSKTSEGNQEEDNDQAAQGKFAEDPPSQMTDISMPIFPTFDLTEQPHLDLTS